MESSLASNIKAIFATNIVKQPQAITAEVALRIRAFVLRALPQLQMLDEDAAENLLSDQRVLDMCPELAIARDAILGGFEQLWAAYHTSPCPPITLTSCKCNVIKPGEMQFMHMHRKTDAFALIYLDDVPSTGEIVLHDPKFVDSPFSYQQVELVAPEIGLLLAAPAYLWHGVNPYYGVTPRVALVANCIVDDVR